MSVDGTRVRRLPISSKLVGAPAWSRDGRKLAFAGGGWVWVVNLDGRGLRRLVRSRGYGATWSPDGKMIAFGRRDRNRGIWVVSADGSGLHRLTRREGDGGPAWSPDGRRIAFHGSDGIYVMGPDGGGRRRLLDDGYGPVWSPDSRQLAYQDSSPASFGGGVWIMHADGSDRQRVAPGDQVSGITWGPPGRAG
jgi:Tol biopolymer transport system component